MVDSKENDTFDMGVKGFRDRSSPEGGGRGWWSIFVGITWFLRETEGE